MVVGTRSMWPCQAWFGLGLPDDSDRLTGGELADVGFVEVGANADAVEIGYVEKVFAGLDEVVLGDGVGVDGAGDGRADVGVGEAALRGGESSLGVGDLGLGAVTLGLAVTLGAALLEALESAVGGGKALLRGGDFTGRGGAFLLELVEGFEIGGSLLLLQLGAIEIASQGDALFLRAALLHLLGVELGGTEIGLGGGDAR